jgi:hypothetical protein
MTRQIHHFTGRLSRRTWLGGVVFASLAPAATWAQAAYAPAEPGEVPLKDGTVARFADVREGIEAITKRDDYIQQLSPFDRQVRLQTARDVSEQELLDFMAKNVVPWSPAEVDKLAPLVAELADKIKPWKLNVPPVVLLVKTTGQEEGRAAYCRGPAIVLPQNMVDGPTSRLTKILAHELFHVTSTHNPQLREKLYASIGFHPCNVVELPPGYAMRKITNPDAPLNNHYVTVTHNGLALELMPVLYSKTPQYDPLKGGSLFGYMTFKLMGLENVDGKRRPLIVQDSPVLLDPEHVAGFYDLIGRNTKYIIHPEEVLADNFVFLLDGRIDLPTQRIVEQMGKILQEAG